VIGENSLITKFGLARVVNLLHRTKPNQTNTESDKLCESRAVGSSSVHPLPINRAVTEILHSWAPSWNTRRLLAQPRLLWANTVSSFPSSMIYLQCPFRWINWASLIQKSELWTTPKSDSFWSHNDATSGKIYTMKHCFMHKILRNIGDLVSTLSSTWLEFESQSGRPF
jgi:hypothetical protein